jgi:hypothetical protein
MGDMRYYRHSSTPRAGRLPTTEAGCLAKIREAEQHLAEASRPFSGTYSPRAYAQHQDSKRAAQSRLWELQRHLRRLRGETDQYGDEVARA